MNKKIKKQSYNFIVKENMKNLGYMIIFVSSLSLISVEANQSKRKSASSGSEKQVKGIGQAKWYRDAFNDSSSRKKQASYDDDYEDIDYKPWYKKINAKYAAAGVVTLVASAYAAALHLGYVEFPWHLFVKDNANDVIQDASPSTEENAAKSEIPKECQPEENTSHVEGDIQPEETWPIEDIVEEHSQDISGIKNDVGIIRADLEGLKTSNATMFWTTCVGGVVGALSLVGIGIWCAVTKSSPEK